MYVFYRKYKFCLEKVTELPDLMVCGLQKLIQAWIEHGHDGTV
jgi:hypothetical protein